MPPVLPWSDARRILRKRAQIIEGLNDPELSGSLQAFLSWRAFLVVARGSSAEQTETGLVQSLVQSTMPHFPALRPAATAFIHGITALSKQSPAVLEEWYGSSDNSPERNSELSARARRRCQGLAAWAGTMRSASTREASDIAAEMYSIRNSAIAHASVHTTGNVFLGVIVPFGQLAAKIACAGIASRAGCELELVFSDAAVDV